VKSHHERMIYSLIVESGHIVERLRLQESLHPFSVDKSLLMLAWPFHLSITILRLKQAMDFRVVGNDAE